MSLRVAALAYAIDNDDTVKNLPDWIFTFESDFEADAIRAALVKYPWAREPVKVIDHGSLVRVDESSGKRFAYWSVKMLKENEDGVIVEVGCVKGGLNGYRQVLLLQKKWGQWRVVSSTPTWIS